MSTIINFLGCSAYNSPILVYFLKEERKFVWIVAETKQQQKVVRDVTLPPLSYTNFIFLALEIPDHQ